LSLLEAIRNLDTPLDDGLSEIAEETIAKRLGLSGTVAQQIERYREEAGHNRPVSTDEAISVFRLVGRRPDAPLVYSDAGRRAARYAGRTRGGVARLFLEGSPRAVRRRLETRVTRAAARRLLGIELDLDHGPPEVRLLDSLATRAGYPGTGCYFYSTALAELLRVASGFEGAMVHDRCRARGDELCVWRAAESGDYQ
jgi:hypothetical protein